MPLRPRIDAAQYLHSEWRLVGIVTAYGLACALGIGAGWLLPALWLAVGIIGTTVLLWAMKRRALSLSRVKFPAGIFLAFLLGGLLTMLHIDDLRKPAIAGDRFVQIYGTVTNLEDRIERPIRLTIRPNKITGLSVPDWGLVRLIVRTDIPAAIAVGDEISLSARIGAPQGPIAPGAFDFGRKAFFDQIWATGFATAPVVLERAAPGSVLSIVDRVNRFRTSIAERLKDDLEGPEGGVAGALMVGVKHHLDSNTAEDFRRAGIAHLLAISGLHMGLITAAAFFVLEFGFALIPGLALRVPPRKLAAGGAWLIGLGYLLLSGSSVSTIRAFIMVSVALLAVLLDRRVLSLRSVAVAAGVILLVSPNALLDVSFQMSFSATAGLIAVYERLSRYPWLYQNKIGVPLRVARYTAFTAGTSLVSQIAIAPFAFYHFQSLSMIGIIANVVIVPIMAVLAMPLVLVALVLIPFGLEGLVTPALGLLLEIIIDLAAWFSAQPYAIVQTPQPGKAFLVVSSVAFMLFLTLRGRALVVAALVALPLPWLLTASGPAPDVLIDNGGNVVAQAGRHDGRLYIAGGRRGGFRDENWARYWGLDLMVPPKELPRRCDRNACDYFLLDGRIIATVRSMRALRYSCSERDIVIIPRRWRRYCRGSALVLLSEDVEEKGPAGIDLNTNKVSWSINNDERPWYRHPVP